jgi:hypothetical protein
MTNFYLITNLLYYLQVTKQPIKPHQAQNIYLTKDQQIQGKVDWIVKDPEAWDVMCEWWMSAKFRAILEKN